jgi:hypothetical protein
MAAPLEMLELTEKTMCFRSNKDDTGRQLDPAEIASSTAIQTPGNAAELGEKSMPTLDGTTDATDSRLPSAAAFGRLHPKARRVGAGIGRTIAVSAIGTGTRQIPRVRLGYRRFCRRRLHHHRLQHRLGLYAIVSPRLGHDSTQR